MPCHQDYRSSRWRVGRQALVVLLLQSLSAHAKLFRGPYLFSDDETIISDLSDSTYIEETGKSGPLLVNFYAPWCGHCQHFAPIYKQLAADYADKDVRFTAVSCQANSALCTSEKVMGYPTIKAWGFAGITNGYVVPNRRDDAVRDWLATNLPGAASGAPQPAAAIVAGASSLLSPPAGFAAGRKRQEKEMKAVAAAAVAAVPGASSAVSGVVFEESDVESLQGHRIADALTSILFTFEKEAFLGVTTLQGGALEALRAFLRVLSLSFPGPYHRLAFTQLLSEVDELDELPLQKWDEMVSRLIRRPLFSHLSTGQYKWGFCEQAGKNGYTCGLWTLFHILTAKSGGGTSANGGATSRVTMEAIHDFVKHFFGCAMCRSHFLAIYEANSFGRQEVYDADEAGDNRALVLWLWEFHNGVNVRVAMETSIAAEGNDAGDDNNRGAFTWESYRAKLWPSPKECPECWSGTPAEVEARVTDFAQFDEAKYAAYIDVAVDKDKVYRWMVKAYGIADTVSAALPQMLDGEANLFSGLRDSVSYYGGVGALCIILLLFLLRYRSVWKFKTLTGRHKKVDRSSPSWMSFNNQQLLP